MAEAFKPGPSGSYLVEDGKVVGHISFGGKELLMPVNGKTILFEMHHYCGPIPLNKKTGESTKSGGTKSFWDACERWGLGGQLVDGNLCVVREWCSECKGTGEEIEMWSERTGESIGPCKSCGGSKLEPASKCLNQIEPESCSILTHSPDCTCGGSDET